MTDVVELENITKTFDGTVANKNISLSVSQGTIHTLLGENGAGKTTLMKILYGHFRPDSGSIIINGESRQLDSPRDGISAGIGMIHQHFMLVDNMTVSENVFLGEESTDFLNVLVDEADEEKQVRELSETYGFDLDPTAHIEEISVGEQQRVEILKTLSRDADIIILDEPTAVLTPQEVDELFSILRTLREKGKTIFLITHKLNEALEISDEITILRDGQHVDTVVPDRVSNKQLAEMMVGREVLLNVQKEDQNAGEIVMEVSGLTIRQTENVETISDVSFDVREGEIFGIAGVDGNGQTELAEAIAGTREITAGTIQFEDRDISSLSRQERIQSGISYIPADRETQGLVMELDMHYNGMLGNQYSTDFSSRVRLLWTRIREHVLRLTDKYDVRPGNPKETASSLSGGNKQKFIVGRELEREPTLLLAAQPTRGVDIGSIEFIREQLLGMRDQGKAVLLISSKLDEAMELSDRLAVMYEGEVVDIVDPDKRTGEEVGLLMAGEQFDEPLAPTQ